MALRVLGLLSLFSSKRQCTNTDLVPHQWGHGQPGEAGSGRSVATTDFRSGAKDPCTHKKGECWEWCLGEDYRRVDGSDNDQDKTPIGRYLLKWWLGFNVPRNWLKITYTRACQFPSLLLPADLFSLPATSSNILNPGRIPYGSYQPFLQAGKLQTLRNPSAFCRGSGGARLHLNQSNPVFPPLQISLLAGNTTNTSAQDRL